MLQDSKWQVDCQNEAIRFSVSPVIHQDDHIFNFLTKHPGFSSDEQRVAYYFRDGARSAAQFWELIADEFLRKGLLPDVLEFASGYGCVTRHLVRNERMNLWTCDIHPAAVDFLVHRLGARAIQSSSTPEDLQLPIQFDVVFALSFFSHMPITTWARWLVRLAMATKPGGLLAFTTHGASSRQHFDNPEISELGFWYLSSSEQKDISIDEYGQTIVTTDFVRKQVATIPSVELVDIREAYWWGHQDLFVVRKRA